MLCCVVLSLVSIVPDICMQLALIIDMDMRRYVDKQDGCVCHTFCLC